MPAARTLRTPGHLPRAKTKLGQPAPLIVANGNTQKGRWNRGGVLLRALVLAVEQRFQLFLQIAGAIGLFRGIERVHRPAVIPSERRNKLRRRAGKLECISILQERDVVLWAAANRSITFVSMPQVIGLTKPSGG